MRRNALRAALLLACSMTFGLKDVRAQAPAAAPPVRKEVAVTIDDLPLNGPRIELRRLREMTGRLVNGFNKYHVPAVGFVNEGLLYVAGETDARIAVLKTWMDGGLELGNHTFSHLGFRHTPLARYEDDFVRGDAVTKMLSNEKGLKVRYFRHPFLQMGDTAELEKEFESFIAERGYRIAPVTVSTWDWMFLAAYSKARAAGDAAQRKRVSDEYLKFSALNFDYAERVAAELFGRPVRHILLLHANELNADNFDALIKVMTDRGYRFITLEEALADPVYQPPDKYLDTSDWLGGWSFAKGRKFDAPAPPDYIQKAYADAQK